MSNVIELTKGKTYNVSHSRKGKFQMRVDRVRGDFAYGVVVAGKAGAMLEENERHQGEEVSVRMSLITYAEEAGCAAGGGE